MQQQKSAFTNHLKVNNNALLASYKVAYHVARANNPHTIADAWKKNKVPLSNGNISQRIKHMTENISAQLFLLSDGKEFAEDILLCKQIEKATTGHDLFKILDNFISLHEIDWENCVGVCTDRVSFMAAKQGTSSSHQSKSDQCNLDAFHYPWRSFSRRTYQWGAAWHSENCY